ncbi:MAG: DUF444 family protein [Candidatus Niyogibacteria bacterium]|nr:DUF444 family protein [Candidatus Niyogibacteria bacterium]
MSITRPDNSVVRGKEDAKRHREKQKEVIKKNLPHIIADESIITRKGGKIVKVPIKAIDIPDFRPKKEGGDGSGVWRGNEPGEDYIEAEMEIEELIALMLEDLGLPNLEEKDEKQLSAEFGFEIRGRAKSGPWSLLDGRTTAKEGIRRFYFLLAALREETKRSELECFAALKRARGITEDALKLLADPNFRHDETAVDPFPILGNDDLRFRKINEIENYESQAVIIAMMDVSGSMSDEKKYLARSMLFWLTAFLRKIYEKVEIRFIIHHSEAKIVDEELFFKTGESGGTCGHTAYELARGLIDTEYHTNRWNVYVWHFSDGEDFYPERVTEEMKRVLGLGISMLGYGEIRPTAEDGPRNMLSRDSELLREIKESFIHDRSFIDGLEMIVGKEDALLGAVIERKEHLLPALKEFLNRKRWGDGK